MNGISYTPAAPGSYQVGISPDLLSYLSGITQNWQDLAGRGMGLRERLAGEQIQQMQQQRAQAAQMFPSQLQQQHFNTINSLFDTPSWNQFRGDLDTMARERALADAIATLAKPGSYSDPNALATLSTYGINFGSMNATPPGSRR